MERAKALGVEDIAFHRKAGITISEMVRSAWVFRRLRDFRSGIEGVISTLKRAFQMDRCTWRGLESFKSYVWSCVTSFKSSLPVTGSHEARAASLSAPPAGKLGVCLKVGSQAAAYPARALPDPLPRKMITTRSPATTNPTKSAAESERFKTRSS